MQGEIIMDFRRTKTWLRVVSALLALTVAWAFVVRIVDGTVDTWFSSAIMLAALYGGYLFGHFALYGYVPGAPAGTWGEQARNNSSDS